MDFFTKLSSTVGNSDSYAALLWGSLSAVATAIGLTVWRRIMPLTEAVETLTNGIKSMLGAIMILTFAWSLQGVIEDMGTASYLQQIVGTWLPAWALPVITYPAVGSGGLFHRFLLGYHGHSLSLAGTPGLEPVSGGWSQSGK